MIIIFLGSKGMSAISAQSDLIDTSVTDEVYMIQGEVVTLKVDGLTRLSVTHPEVADIVEADDKEVMLVGQSVGQTVLFVWDNLGKRTIMIHVFSKDLELTRKRIERLLASAGIEEVNLEINEKEGKIFATGELLPEKKEDYDRLVEKFSGEMEDLVKEKVIDDLIQIDMQVTELSTTLSKTLGIEWFTGTQTVSGNKITTTTSGGFAPTYGEIQPSFDGSIGDFFKIGEFQRATNSALVAQVNALLSEGKARVLSQPRLVVVSGEQASFLVGGEVPIRTTTATGSGATQENVEFKNFGISMDITPTIRKGKIDIDLGVEVSDIDAATPVAGEVAFVTRSAQTKLYLDDGQTIVLAGLIKHNTSETVKKVPFLGDVPVLGLLFRTKDRPADKDQELVIALTPTILSSAKNQSTKKDKAQEKDIMVSSEKPLPPQKEASSSVAESSQTMTEASPLKKDTDQKPTVKTWPQYPGVPLEMVDYVQALQRTIAQAIVYPREAEQYGWEGTVKLTLLILNDGTLAFALVRESSGYNIFDEYALNTAKNIAPYSSFPSTTQLQELNVTIPIVYSLKRN